MRVGSRLVNNPLFQSSYSFNTIIFSDEDEIGPTQAPSRVEKTVPLTRRSQPGAGTGAWIAKLAEKCRSA